MAVFVAGSDESASGDGAGEFYFGGFVAPERDWSEYFVPAWVERVLSTSPKLDYLHVSDVKSIWWRRKHGINEIDAERKIDEAVRVIRSQGSLYPITASLNADHFRSAVAQGNVRMLVRTPGGVARARFVPDYLCFLRFVVNTLLYVREAHSDAEKVDFVIERNGPITRYIQRFHESIPKGLRDRGRSDLAALVGDLIPAGKDHVPLQAADLLCWYTRNASVLNAVDRRRYASMADRFGILSRASEAHVGELVAELKAEGLTCDADDEGVISAV